MSHRILLIDDEDDILEFIRYNLTKAGYEVYTARNGAEGLQQAAAHRPHLILLDVMMPVMDGIETCRALRRDPALKETMVVFLSALGEEEQQLAGFGAGADDYIPKPIKPKLLLSRIQAILKRVAADKPASLVIDRERHLVIRNGERIELPLVICPHFGNLTIRIVNYVCTLRTTVFQLQLHLKHAIFVKLGISSSVQSSLRFVCIVLTFIQKQVLCKSIGTPSHQ